MDSLRKIKVLSLEQATVLPYLTYRLARILYHSATEKNAGLDRERGIALLAAALVGCSDDDADPRVVLTGRTVLPADTFTAGPPGVLAIR